MTKLGALVRWEISYTIGNEIHRRTDTKQGAKQSDQPLLTSAAGKCFAMH